MQLIMRIISSVISVYLILLFIRVFLTWFRSPDLGKPLELLAKITDPYLNYFKQFKFLQFGRMDFSPIAAFIVLIIIMNIITTIETLGRITLGIILALILQVIWSAASFLLTFFLILIIIRLITLLFGASSISVFIRTLDTIIQPILNWINKTLFKNKLTSYKNGLGISAVVLILFTIVGNLVVSKVSQLLQMLPF